MKEIKVGERVTIEAQEVPQNSSSCKGCCFDLDRFECDISTDIFGECKASCRSDGKNIIFKEVKE